MSHSKRVTHHVSVTVNHPKFSEQLVTTFEWLTSVYGTRHHLHRIAAEAWAGRSRPSFWQKVALLRAIKRWQDYDFYSALRKEVKRL